MEILYYFIKIQKKKIIITVRLIYIVGNIRLLLLIVHNIYLKYTSSIYSIYTHQKTTYEGFVHT